MHGSAMFVELRSVFVRMCDLFKGDVSSRDCVAANDVTDGCLPGKEGEGGGGGRIWVQLIRPPYVFCVV
jgi:hypothetical protein